MKERLIEFLRHLKIGQTRFEEKTGISRGLVNNIRDGVSSTSISKISAAYPELNIEWLITGRGSMLKTGEGEVPESASVPSDTVSYRELYENAKIEINRLHEQIGALKREVEALGEARKRQDIRSVAEDSGERIA
jgi:transcriptional regulator with XRE-family HTH domain